MSSARGCALSRFAAVGLGVLLVAALPLLLAVLATGPGGLPHEAGFQAAGTHDASVAALDRLERWFQGDLTVRLQDLENPATLSAALPRPLPPLLPSALHGTAIEGVPAVAVPPAADAVRRF